MMIYHGSRVLFDEFDVAFKGTGESGDIGACWFADNFEGAKNHALYRNRNDGEARVYCCEVSERAVIVDHHKPLSEQPIAAELLMKNLPVAISCSLGNGYDWYSFTYPRFKDRNGYYIERSYLSDNELIALYKNCGLHGVDDWEGCFTDAYIKGRTIIVFDFSILTIKEIITV